MSGETACYYHPSQQAVTKCQKCGQPVCDGCFDKAWRDVRGWEKKDAGTFCHHCVGKWMVEREIEWSDEVIKTIKSRCVWTKRLSLTGLVIGLLLAVAAAIFMASAGATSVGFAVLWGIVCGGTYTWVGMGWGCSLPAFLSKVRDAFRTLWGIFNGSISKDFLGTAIIEVILAGFVLTIIGTFAGPIIYSRYLSRRKKDINEIEALVESNTDILKTLRSADAAQNDPAVQSKISQSANAFVDNMAKRERLQKPLLWFYN
jgi:hypothetical protein